MGDKTAASAKDKGSEISATKKLIRKPPNIVVKKTNQIALAKIGARISQSSFLGKCLASL